MSILDINQKSGFLSHEQGIRNAKSCKFLTRFLKLEVKEAETGAGKHALAPDFSKEVTSEAFSQLQVDLFHI